MLNLDILLSPKNKSSNYLSSKKFSNKKLPDKLKIRTTLSPSFLKYSKQVHSCRSPVLSPSQLESRERLKHLNFLKLNKKEAQSQINIFKKSLNIKLSKISEKESKKFESHGLFSKELNKLREQTSKEVSLHKQYIIFSIEIYKKQAILNNKKIIDYKSHFIGNFQEEEEEISIDKTKSRQLLLDNFKMKITHKPNKPSASQPEHVEQKSSEDFLNYLKWLSSEGLKQYEVPIAKMIKINK